MKILITGATGLIGKELGKRLTDHGHEVFAVSRSRVKAIETLPYQAAGVIEWNGEGEFPVSTMKEIEVVVNLMGENLGDHRWTDSFKEKLVTSRVATTEALVTAAQDAPQLKTWIQGVAIGIYGETKPGVPATETTPPGSEFLADLCVEWEAATVDLSPSIRQVMARTGVVLSHRGGAFAQLVSPILNGIGGVLGSGEQLMSLIHLDDEVRFLLHAIENESVKGIFNLVCDSPVSQKQLAEMISSELNAPLGPKVPAFALKIAIGEMANMLLENQAVISKRFAEVGFILNYPTPQSIVKEVCSWHQNPVEPGKSAFVKYEEQFIPKGIQEILAFFQEAKNLETLTPPFLNFKIQSVSTPQIEEHTQIKYDLKIHGVPITWVTDIAVWDPPHRFVDNQLSGPYSLWYHEHRFTEVKGGVLVTDWIRYRLPLGKLGKWIGYNKVKSDVDAIFAFRRGKVREIFV